MTKTQTQNVIKKLMGRKGGLETQKRKLKLFETATDIGFTEAAIRAAEEQIAAVTREIETARARAEAEARLEHELRYIEIAKELDKRIPELAGLAADAIMALHDAYPKTGAAWASPEGFTNCLLKSLGFALVRDLRGRGQTGLAAVVQIQSGTFAAPPPKPLSQAFVSDLALRTWEKRRHDAKGGDDDGTN